MIRHLLYALIPLLLLAGCRKDDTVRYTGTEMGQVQNGVIVSDNQVRFVVEDNPGNFDLLTGRRVLFSYRTLAPGTDDSFRIELVDLHETVITDPVPADEPIGVVSDDPVDIEDAWFSGGYLNIAVVYRGTDPTRHDFPLTYLSDEKELTLRLYHDNRETAAPENAVIHAYLCFPLEAITEAYCTGTDKSIENVSTIPVTLQWLWYKEDGSSQTELYRQSGQYTPVR